MNDPTIRCTIHFEREFVMRAGNDMLDAFIDFEFAARRDEFKVAIAQRRLNARLDRSAFPYGGHNE
jgi:hypothetical protein